MSTRKRNTMFFEVAALSAVAVMAFVFSYYIQRTVERVRGVNASTSYYVSPNGSDSNSGTEDLPWRTMDYAIKSLKEGNTLYVRAGTYETIEDAWRFRDSGTPDNPISVRNYPGEQAVFKINSTRMERRAFRCMYDPSNPSVRQPSPANNIKLIGSDIPSAKTLSNGVSSIKGLVVLGIEGANAVGVESIGPHCNNWEIAGFDFIETGGGIFQRNGPSERWSVHDNRVFNFYRESGMQFNGNNNVITNNEIYLVNSTDRTYGCQTINLLGHGNIVRNNKLSRDGSTHKCLGVLFEWDLADENLVENNIIEDVPIGVTFEGGDRNIVRNNTIRASASGSTSGVNIKSYDGVGGWPCNESNSSFSNLLPPNDPNHPNYKYYYNPRNCHSMNNQITGNVISGFPEKYRMFPVTDSSNYFSDSGQSSSPTLTPRPTVSLTPTPSPRQTNTPTPRPTNTLTPTPGPRQTNTPIPRQTSTPTPVPTPIVSEVVVYAAGTSASGVYPTLELLINDRVVARWSDIRGNPALRIFRRYTYKSPASVRIEQIKLRYSNDAKVGKNDRNVKVDKLVLNGKAYQTEANSTFSTGTWSKNGGCSDGYKSSEWLHCNGNLQYR